MAHEPVIEEPEVVTHLEAQRLRVEVRKDEGGDPLLWIAEDDIAVVITTAIGSAGQSAEGLRELAARASEMADRLSSKVRRADDARVPQQY
jgi:hypothetical protein